MKEEMTFLEQAENYLNGEMSETEQAAFEKILVENIEAKKHFDEYRTLRSRLEEHTSRQEVKLSLSQAYDEWKAMEQPSQHRKKVSVLWKAAAVAASLALLISIGGFWLTMNRLNQHKTNSYTILRREIDDIKRSQKDLMDDLLTSGKPANPGQYGGTGFAISANGYLATNAHVIRGADSIYVVTHDGRSLKASLVFEEQKCDLAILKIVDSTFNIPALPFELSSTSAPLGQEIYTLGYPRNEIVYGKGYISAETGFEGDSGSYQLTLPVNPGNSGGPLVDEHGQVLGIISGKQSATDNIAFAVKSSYLLKMLDSLPKDFPKKALKNNGSALRHLNRIDQIKKLEKYVFLVKVFN